jgi:hypothetical protein
MTKLSGFHGRGRASSLGMIKPYSAARRGCAVRAFRSLEGDQLPAWAASILAFFGQFCCLFLQLMMGQLFQRHAVT